VLCGLDPPTILDGEGTPIAPLLSPLEGDAPPQLEPPLRRFQASFPEGATLLLVNDGLAAEARHPLPLEEALRRARDERARPVADLVEALLARGEKHAGTLTDDLLVLVLRRAV
jgi:hypothetical protein